MGAGPGGLAAALILADHGVDVVVIDEQARPGGQIYRQPPKSFEVHDSRVDKTHALGKEILRAASDKTLRFRLETTVWGLFAVGVDGVSAVQSAPELGSVTQSPAAAVESAPEVGLALSGGRGVELFRARRVLLAPGAFDLPVAFAGWTLPGVMAAGGIQAFVKSQRFLPGNRFCFVGAHPLQILIADQLANEGAEIAGVYFAQSRPSFSDAIKQLADVRNGWEKLWKSLGAWRRLQRAGIPISFGKIIVRAEGHDEVERAVVASVDDSWNVVPGTEETIACDTIGLNYGFLPSTELGRQAGCRHRWSAREGGWVLEHDEWMRSSQPYIYLAGEITGVAGADVAISEGRLAAVGLLKDLARIDPERANRMAASIWRKLRRERRFARALQDFSAPRFEALARLMSDETTVCRCEEISAGQVKLALRENPHLGTANAVKLFTRTGMGPCQGRFCALGVAGLIAAKTGNDISEIGPFTARPPTKPVPLADLSRYWEETNGEC